MNGNEPHQTGTNGILSGQGQSRLFSFSPKPSIESFTTVCSQKATLDQYPLATSIKENIPIYDLPSYSALTPEQRSALQDEWYGVLLQGPGVFVTSGLFRDDDLIDKVTNTFHQIIEKEKQTVATHGDHFAGAGKNDRIWNSFSKHGLNDPASFLSYYSNPYLALISSAWLGPGYRITAQVNNVKPGSAPQVSHRDYHLGFMSTESCSQYPRAMQVASQCLTLQGAVAHVDVPLESGPTRLLPFSQTFPAGYMAYRLPEFNEYFLENYVALPLTKGDGLFFNPALFHAAGENKSADIHRLANLVQISSAFGKPMETIDALPLVESTWDALNRLYEGNGLSDEVKSFVAAIGEGYPFPTNLDRNPPRADNMAPESEQDVIMSSLVAGKSKAEVLGALKRYRIATQA
ncbi:Fc.00g084860.m01.CDS01 [Cosmosporella sp. VM-42]